MCWHHSTIFARFTLFQSTPRRVSLLGSMIPRALHWRAQDTSVTSSNWGEDIIPFEFIVQTNKDSMLKVNGNVRSKLYLFKKDYKGIYNLYSIQTRIWNFCVNLVGLYFTWTFFCFLFIQISPSEIEVENNVT